MPIDESRVRCLDCGKHFTVGDCIVHTCPECECLKQGHLPVGKICGRCGKKLPPLKHSAEQYETLCRELGNAAEHLADAEDYFEQMEPSVATAELGDQIQRASYAVDTVRQRVQSLLRQAEQEEGER